MKGGLRWDILLFLIFLFLSVYCLLLLRTELQYSLTSSLPSSSFPLLLLSTSIKKQNTKPRKSMKRRSHEFT